MNKIGLLLIILLISMGISACAVDQEETPVASPEPLNSNEDTLTVVASLFPQYDFARQVIGDKGEVTLILPPGIEPHSFEPTPQEMVSLYGSDLFLYTGDVMEPWATRLVGDYEGVIVDLSENIDLTSVHEGHVHVHEDEHTHEDEHAHMMDPHYWTDPNFAIVMVETIRDAVIQIDPENQTFYKENADVLIQELTTLDEAIRHVVENSKSDTIISGGHFAFGYFVDRYHLKHISPYEGFSPDAEPSPQKLAQLIETIRETGANALFFEELIDPKIAKIIAEEAGVEMLLLHAAHNVTKDEKDQGKTYFDFMYENLDRLKIGLDYNE
ncbi:metal ABC transporter solute-binding protein, Zn/Mn family [Fusibacter tunisiensis]|uniref:Zinc transport system substrate-binding protein n=1 Tax=Fusibacter tunisiensis TaxID=1008308 RepID=A0ABS2MPL3_9FIRM|nr:zinc ABC transporter substrate-binding protein [Fusibacter tunisiensis]MBM7561257.1 zinc transport system substrate-binding protein [Fusibacter tunisiensis]